MVSHSNSSNNSLFSIGDVAQVTGISVFTLRMWERRYGQPVSVKLASGHRRYSTHEISRLKLVKTLTDAGEKASVVLKMNELRLKELATKHSSFVQTQVMPSFAVEQILEKADSWDDTRIYNIFEKDWQALGPMGFISGRAESLLLHVGKGWAEGLVSISKEHFISGILEKFLREKWSSINERNSGSKVLLSSLEGEEHAFGLHFCAVASAVSGRKVIFLDKPMPEDEIISAAINSGSTVICLSLSKGYCPNLAVKKIKYLRKKIPLEIELVIGGGGAPANIKGVQTISRCQSLYDWLRLKEGVNNNV